MRLLDKEEDEPRALLQASREVRVAALDCIEPLLDALVENAQRIITAIEKGRMTVDKL